jgi:hypothetical protein
MLTAAVPVAPAATVAALICRFDAFESLAEFADLFSQWCPVDSFYLAAQAYVLIGRLVAVTGVTATS